MPARRVEVPLRDGATGAGVMTLGFADPDRPAGLSPATLRTIGEQVAGSLHRARLVSDLRRRKGESEALSRLLMRISRQEDLATTLTWFVDRGINLNNGNTDENSFIDLDLRVWQLSGPGGTQVALVGASISQTGPYAAPAQNQLRGYRLCVKHTNERGGVLGRKLELIVEDDRSQPATAARIYEKLITQDKVDAILGP